VLFRGDAQIQEDGMDTIGEPREEDVLGLHVLVAEPTCMKRGQRAGERMKNLVRLIDRDRLTGGETLMDSRVQRLTIVVWHSEPCIIRRGAMIVQLDDVGVGYGRQRD